MNINWLIGNWHNELSPLWDHIALTLISVFCGYLIGLERERKEKPIGMRTLAMVCLGSTLFTLVGRDFKDAHILAQIISGVGFLGAGAVIHGRFGVSGITSAATLWVVAALGMVIGVGYAGAGLVLALLILLVLSGLRRMENYFLGACHYKSIEVTYQEDGGKTYCKIQEVLDEFHPKLLKPVQHRLPEGKAKLSLNCCLRHPHHRVLLTRIAEVDAVESIEPEDGNWAVSLPLSELQCSVLI